MLKCFGDLELFDILWLFPGVANDTFAKHLKILCALGPEARGVS